MDASSVLRQENARLRSELEALKRKLTSRAGGGGGGISAGKGGGSSGLPAVDARPETRSSASSTPSDAVLELIVTVSGIDGHPKEALVVPQSTEPLRPHMEAFLDRYGLSVDDVVVQDQNFADLMLDASAAANALSHRDGVLISVLHGGVPASKRSASAGKKVKRTRRKKKKKKGKSAKGKKAGGAGAGTIDERVRTADSAPPDLETETLNSYLDGEDGPAVGGKGPPPLSGKSERPLVLEQVSADGDWGSSLLSDAQPSTVGGGGGGAGGGGESPSPSPSASSQRQHWLAQSPMAKPRGERRARNEGGSGFRFSETSATEQLLLKSRALIDSARSMRIPIRRSRKAKFGSYVSQDSVGLADDSRDVVRGGRLAPAADADATGAGADHHHRHHRHHDHHHDDDDDDGHGGEMAPLDSVEHHHELDFEEAMAGMSGHGERKGGSDDDADAGKDVRDEKTAPRAVAAASDDDGGGYSSFDSEGEPDAGAAGAADAGGRPDDTAATRAEDADDYYYEDDEEYEGEDGEPGDDGYDDTDGGGGVGAAGESSRRRRGARRSKTKNRRNRRRGPGRMAMSSLPVPPIPRHLFENVPLPLPEQTGGKLAEHEWENELAKSVLAIYRADVARKAGAIAPLADHLAYDESMRPLSASTDLASEQPQPPLSTAPPSLNGEEGVPGPKPRTPSRRARAGTGTGAGAGTGAGTGGGAEHTGTSPIRRTVVPTNRRGEVLPTIAGGGGGAKGVARLRGGPFPIWFGGGGSAVSGRAVWCGLANRDIEGLPPELTEAQVLASLASGQCVHSICFSLNNLERQGKYDAYVQALRKLLYPLIRSPHRSEIDERQWRQLVVAAQVFAVKYTEEGKWGKALAMLRTTDTLIAEDLDMGAMVKRELSAFVADAYAGYYFRRNQLQAALQASHRATKGHSALKQWDHVAKCHLHTAMILSKLRKHGEAIRCNGQVLQLVDEGRLEMGGASALKICLVAVCYHNIAVDHLILRQSQDACIASQNARRLARLSLSYSNRYMRHFETTHGAALEALAQSKSVREAAKSKEDRKMFKNLSADLFT